MEYEFLYKLFGLGFLIWVVASICQIRNDLKCLNKNMMFLSHKMRIYDSLIEELKELMLQGKKVEAVKKYRQETGCGLKEANDFIDSLKKKKDTDSHR